ncbi:MAG TPA: alpha/beta hydrolase [Steroidobacteraceae bacterium]|nr:alpha/beta hydrolase [Steroidobacteraceae bacterium]
MSTILTMLWLSTAVTAAVPPLDVPVGATPVLEDRFPQASVAFASDVESLPDLVYSAPPGFRPLRLDVYRPRNAGRIAGGLPLVIYVHGGGWQGGHTRHSGAFANWPGVLALLASKGYVVASIEYRLSGEARFPAAIQDVKTSIRWLRSKSAQFGIDATRAIIWGGSAGGQLAALAATSCNVEPLAPVFMKQGSPDPESPLAAQSDCVQGVVAWYGIFDFVNAPLSGPAEQLASSAAGKYLGCALSNCRSTAELASPVSHLDKRDPPALLIHGDLDKVVPVAQSRLFHEALQANNVAAKLLVIEGADHSFIGADAEATRRASLLALNATFEFIDVTVGRTGPVPAGNPQAAGAAIEHCKPRADLEFLCGFQRPEDVVRIPGTRWLIYSGFSRGAGLRLVDTAAHSARPLTYDVSEAHEKGDWPQCRTPPGSAAFSTQGLSIRDLGRSQYRLHVINHGDRESIEIFSVDAQAAEPRFTWSGCVLMPPGLAANSVATFSDGTILVTVLTHPGRTITDFWRGENTGAVYSWTPGETVFRLLAGTELPGNNGLETSSDDKEFFVVAFGWRSVVVFSRDDPSHPLRRAVAPGFMPDNIHWDSGKLLLAGMQYDEPACGGIRKIIDGKADEMRCHRGYTVAHLDPHSMHFTIAAYAEPDPDFNGVSAASIVAGELWLGSYQADRVAWRIAPVAGQAPAHP